MFPHIVKKNFLKKVEKCKCYKHLTEITNIYIIFIIKLGKPIPELWSKQLLVFFLFGIHNNMFLNIVKKKIGKKRKNANVTSDHQAIIKRSSSDHPLPAVITLARELQF